MEADSSTICKDITMRGQCCKRSFCDESVDIEKSATKTPTGVGAGNQSQEKRQKLDFLDRYMALWVLLAMTGGILIGYFIPSANLVLDKGKFAGVSGPIAALLLLMMYPILLDVSFESLPVVVRQSNLWKEVLLNIFVNWLISPLVMFSLAWATLPDASALREGVILVGIARCIAMVLIWVRLAQGDTVLGSLLVTINALIQIILVAPLSVLFLEVFRGGDSSSSASAGEIYTTTASSVAIFLGIPLSLAAVTRLVFLHVKPFRLRRWNTLTPREVYEGALVPALAPLSLVGLLGTIILLFIAQGRHVVAQITSVLRVAAPLCIYFPITYLGTLFLCWKVLPRIGVTFQAPSASEIAPDARLRRMPFSRATMHAFLAASNNFELAIAVATARSGAQSNQSLATSVGPLVEVPVMLGLVWVSDWFRRHWKVDEVEDAIM
ncbi:sodium bile acid symporter family-domain-containing protein [Lipomyces orientalis]|uniref:Sodium bile acid symporter family-domain-containing protein n=1 Tax=Lipomyces orientalis TaxID=1233043 RepID=A0ACC3TLA9_9ASCO